MATYVIVLAGQDSWGQPENRFKSRSAADERVEELRREGVTVRVIRWDDNTPTEVTDGESGGQRVG